MKKIIRLTESDLTRIVRRVITETKSEKLIGFLNSMIDNIQIEFDGETYYDELEDDEMMSVYDDYESFIYFTLIGEMIFKYEIETGSLIYNMDFFKKWISLSDKNIKDEICFWAKENLIPKFSNQFENEFGYDFEITNCKPSKIEKDNIEYDDAGRITYMASPNGSWRKYEYDENGNILYFETSSGHKRKYEYDQNGNVINVEVSD